ncbi:MAG: shikimate dehydrogenase family protein [Bacteroidales bacterium]
MTGFGLIGFPLTHSFSPTYFTDKFLREGLSDYKYDLFLLQKIDELKTLVEAKRNLKGLNVTIPYKVSVIRLLQQLDTTAEAVGAVNTIDIMRNGNKVILSGYNTDVIGFEQSLVPLLKPWHKRALVLGTGGASKAVCHVLCKLGIAALYVSRKPREPNQMSYEQLNKDVIVNHQLIIQTTPLGKYPDTESLPPVPYKHITSDHLLYDLNYNPDTTRFMKLGAKHGASVKNGLEMLHLQADASWEIWKRNL